VFLGTQNCPTGAKRRSTTYAVAPLRQQRNDTGLIKINTGQPSLFATVREDGPSPNGARVNNWQASSMIQDREFNSDVANRRTSLLRLPGFPGIAFARSSSPLLCDLHGKQIAYRNPIEIRCSLSNILLVRWLSQPARYHSGYGQITSNTESLFEPSGAHRVITYRSPLRSRNRAERCK